jgi:hypothetical protein
MSKSLEQTIHEAELPAPGPTGEDFNSYVSRVAHAAAFIGAAWAIANGPQVQSPQPSVEGPDLAEDEQDAPAEMAQPDEPDILPPPGTMQPGSVQRSQDEPTDVVQEHE